MAKLLEANTLYIGDTHFPFENENYLDFLLEIRERVKCKNVKHVGDLVDNHAISYHEHDPDGHSPKDEFNLARKTISKWAKAFPKLKMAIGNHDALVYRKGKTSGLPSSVFKSVHEIWGLPSTWEVGFEFLDHDVRTFHGTGYAGKTPHIQAAYDSRRSAVIGHCHSVGGVEYIDTDGKGIFGMSTGCGIDRHKDAFAYGKDFRFKPILGCGVTTDYGRYAQFFPMKD